MYFESELQKINNARISRGVEPFTKEEFIASLNLSWSLLLDGEVSDEDKNKILNFRDHEYELALKATPSWVKIGWFAILLLVAYGISRML
jgi:hypothetical protein